MNQLILEWLEAGQPRTQMIADQQPSKISGTMRLGRDTAQCDIVLSDATVSPLHAEIFFSPQQQCFYIRSLRDTNPVIVNGMPIRQSEAMLDEGSTIQLGQVGLYVRSVFLGQPVYSYPPTQPSQPSVQMGLSSPSQFVPQYYSVNSYSQTLAQFSITQPTGRFSFLSLITGGVYSLHWYYMNWRAFGYSKFNAIVFSLFGTITIYSLAKRISRLASEQGITVGVAPSILLFFSVLGSVVGLFGNGWINLGFLIMGTIIYLFPGLYLQQLLNAYWLKLEPHRSQRAFLSGGLIAWSIFGFIFWGLIILGVLYPDV